MERRKKQRKEGQVEEKAGPLPRAEPGWLERTWQAFRHPVVSKLVAQVIWLVARLALVGLITILVYIGAWGTISQTPLTWSPSAPTAAVIRTPVPTSTRTFTPSPPPTHLPDTEVTYELRNLRTEQGLAYYIVFLFEGLSLYYCEPSDTNLERIKNSMSSEAIGQIKDFAVRLKGPDGTLPDELHYTLILRRIHFQGGRVEVYMREQWMGKFSKPEVFLKGSVSDAIYVIEILADNTYLLKDVKRQS